MRSWWDTILIQVSAVSAKTHAILARSATLKKIRTALSNMRSQVLDSAQAASRKDSSHSSLMKLTQKNNTLSTKQAWFRMPLSH
jgi:hypothetical protein